MTGAIGNKRKATALLTTDAMRFVRIERRLRSGQATFEQLRGCVGDVSAATLKRDLKAMREELGAPIHWDSGNRAYHLAGEWPGVGACLWEEVRPA